MNIFFLDKNPTKAAQFHNNKHVVKMVTESAQMLSTVHWVCGSHTRSMHRPTHQHHPCVVWLLKSKAHYEWTLELFVALLHEYTHRYGKIHKCFSLYPLFAQIPNLPDAGWSTPAKAMPEYLRCLPVVNAYRAYYILHKGHIGNWTNRPVPSWYA
jgi:hypothetical protein